MYFNVWSLPAVGCALLARCRSTLSCSGWSFLPAVGCSLFSCVRHDFASRTVSAPRRRCLRGRLSRSASAELTSPVQCEVLVSSRSWLSRRAAHHAHSRAAPQHCAWYAGLTNTTLLLFLPALCVEVHVSRAWLLQLSHSRRPLALANGLNMTAIVFREFRFGVLMRPCVSCSASASGVHSRRRSVVATLRSCRRCVWLCASRSVGTSRRRHGRID